MIWMRGLSSSKLLSAWIIRLGPSGCWLLDGMLSVLPWLAPLRLLSSGAFSLMGIGLWFCDFFCFRSAGWWVLFGFWECLNFCVQDRKKPAVWQVVNCILQITPG